jgi:hypothetical protein
VQQKVVQDFGHFHWGSSFRMMGFRPAAHSPQNLVAAPSLKAPMHGFVALRQHVTVRTGVENPQRRFKHTTRGNRLAASSTVKDVLFGKWSRMRPH